MNILIVDDEAAQRDILAGFLEKQGYAILTAQNGREALDIFMDHPVDLVLVDQRMPDMNGTEVLAEIKKVNPMVRAIMITAFGSVDTAVQIMQIGADDFMEKPINLKKLLDKIQQLDEKICIEQDIGQIDEAIDTARLPVRMIGESAAMKKLLSLVVRAAPTPWTILIRGETGTGKELIARLVHQLSRRKDGPFIELNCAAVPESLFESELFGHEKGAFTGAEARRRGVFEQANGGTLLLDEAGELPLAMQAKLLRTLQENTITRVGGERPFPVELRIIAATNRDLKDMVGRGKFREDLYFRLNVIELEIPPLRQRKEDIPALVDFFLAKYKSDAVFTQDTIRQLGKYSFPGNVRELEHIIQRTVTLARSSVIRPHDLPPEIRTIRVSGETGNLNQRIAEVERQMLLDALESNNWVQTRAAETLGISERVLRYKMAKAGIMKNQG